MKNTIRFVILIFLTMFLLPLDLISAEDISKAKDLYLTKCAKCHKLYEPSTYDDGLWRQWMEKMREKARLDSEEYDLLTDYCNFLRKDTSLPISKNQKNK